MLCFDLRRFSWPRTGPSPRDAIIGRRGEGLVGVPGAAVLLCRLGEEAGEEFPYSFCGEKRGGRELGAGSESEAIVLTAGSVLAAES